MRLEEWLERTGIRRNEFARRIGVKPQTITGYCDGSFPPSLQVAWIIAQETKGEVMPNDFTIRRKPKRTSPRVSPCA